jgi:hypothetical protein
MSYGIILLFLVNLDFRCGVNIPLGNVGKELPSGYEVGISYPLSHRLSPGVTVVSLSEERLRVDILKIDVDMRYKFLKVVLGIYGMRERLGKGLEKEIGTDFSLGGVFPVIKAKRYKLEAIILYNTIPQGISLIASFNLPGL